MHSYGIFQLKYIMKIILNCSPSLGILDNWLPILFNLKERKIDLEFIIYFPHYFIINQLFQNEVKNDTTYILKYMKNDFSRIHVDDLRGEVDRVDISILYYLCNQWIWDWGGILMIAKSTKDEDMHAIMPKGNRIIFINNQKKLPILYLLQ